MNRRATWRVPSPRLAFTDHHAASGMKVEMLFAHMKRILRFDRLRLRRRSRARDKFLLTAIARNLRRLALTVPPMLMEALPAPG
jgi:hypothetical protein